MDQNTISVSTRDWVTAALGLLAILVLVLIWQKDIVVPKFFAHRTVSEIIELRVYPIKSCRGFKVESTTVTRQGLDLDRRWMFVDENKHEFLTIRQKSQMTLINTKLEGDDLVISIAGTGEFVRIPARPNQEWLEKNTKLTSVLIWGTETDAYEYPEEINRTFTKFFEDKVSLVYKGPSPRICGGNGAKEYLGREESVNFPDVLPVQISSSASIDELNTRLKAKGHGEISIERFRPNIVIKGDGAWTEDSWKTVRINDNIVIDVVARCARCQVPNVDCVSFLKMIPAGMIADNTSLQDTGEKDQHEPWDTLMKYRRVDPGMKYKPCFGMLTCPRNEGPISIGMKFEVTETTEKHFYRVGF